MIGLLILSMQIGEYNPVDGRFALGIHHRENSTIAKTHFANAAKGYERQWPANSNLKFAMQRLRVNYLAGNTPQALVACHDGLLLEPTNKQFQAELEYLRSQSEAKSYFPRPWLLSRVRQWDLFILASIACLIFGIGIIRHFTTGASWSRALIIAGFSIGIIVLLMTVQMKREERPNHLGITLDDQILRTGNGESYPSRLPNALPAGSEVRELHRRGGWVQIELPSGEAGWLPEPMVRMVGQ